MDNQTLFTIAQEISRAVAEKIKQSSGLGALTGGIGKSGDQTKQGDQLVEDELRKVIPPVLLKYQIKSCWIVSEETGQWKIGQVDEKSEGIFMIIDPIDGSNNMRPHFTPQPILCFSIAIGYLKNLFFDGTLKAVEVGLARDIFHDEEYWSVKGQGAFLDKIKLQTSKVIDLREAVLGASLDRTGEKLEKIFQQGLYKLLLATKCQRRIGSTIADLCRVATGDYDLHISLSGDVKLHDIAAGKLLIEEAGGAVELYRDGKMLNEEKWLLKLWQEGDEGIKNIRFKMLAGGNKILLDKAKKFLVL